MKTNYNRKYLKKFWLPIQNIVSTLTAESINFNKCSYSCEVGFPAQLQQN